MPQPRLLWARVVTSNRGATSSVQELAASDRRCTTPRLGTFSPVRGYRQVRHLVREHHCSMDVASTSRIDRSHQHGLLPARLHMRLGRAIAIIALLAVLTGAARLPEPQDPWRWPVEGVRQVTEFFHAPAHDYGPGHRGIDLAAPDGTVVHAPADGVVAFRGVVVDRPLITIDHGSGVVTTFEPVTSTLEPGSAISAGDEIGVVATGGHSPAGEMHLGVRWNDVYINPLLMFQKVPRAILLPCCH